MVSINKFTNTKIDCRYETLIFVKEIKKPKDKNNRRLFHLKSLVPICVF